MQSNLPPTLNLKKIGERIECLILQNYDSISEFSTRTGISLTSLYETIRGHAVPSPLNLIRLSHYLGCSVDFLLGICSAEMDPVEGYETTVLNIREFAEFWSPRKIRYLMKLIEKEPIDKTESNVHPVDKVKLPPYPGRKTDRSS